jgi:hypothetical protein
MHTYNTNIFTNKKNVHAYKMTCGKGLFRGGCQCRKFYFYQDFPEFYTVILLNASGLFLLLARPESNLCGSNKTNNPGQTPRNNNVQNKGYNYANFDEYLQTESERQALGYGLKLRLQCQKR